MQTVLGQDERASLASKQDFVRRIGVSKPIPAYLHAHNLLERALEARKH